MKQSPKPERGRASTSWGGALRGWPRARRLRHPPEQHLGLGPAEGGPAIAAQPITPLGFSLVPFLILGGLGLLALFAGWVERRKARARRPCWTSMLWIPTAARRAVDARVSSSWC